MHSKIQGKNTRRLAAGTAALLIMAVAMSGCSAGKADNAKPEDVIAQEEAVMIKTTRAEMITFTDTVQISGTAGASEEAEITAKIGGDIFQLKGEIGDPVSKGQVLAKIDATRYALTKEKAGLGVSSAQLNYDQQKVDFERVKALYDQGALSKKEYEAAQNGYRMTEIALKSAQADLKSADINLRDTTVSSPINGYIGARMVNSGESVNPGTPLFTVVDLSQVTITAGIAESAVNTLKQGMKVQVTFDALAGQTFEGTITQISPVQDQAKLYPVKIQVANPEGKIRSGMFASASVALSGGVEGLAVPKEAVLHEQGKDYVFVVSGDKALRKEVVVGLGDDKLYQIKSGVNAGDPVVTSGQETLKDGTLVKIGK